MGKRWVGGEWVEPEKRIQTGLRLGEGLHDRLTAESSRRNRSKNKLIEVAVEQLLDRIETRDRWEGLDLPKEHKE